MLVVVVWAKLDSPNPPLSEYPLTHLVHSVAEPLHCAHGLVHAEH